MNWRLHCAAVIPCLNEARTIGPLVRAVRRHFDTVLVVDDGSADQTAPLARAAGAAVLRHAQPRGKGAALAAGLDWVHQQHFAWALLMDGDGQHSPDDIPSLLRQAARAGPSLVIGNRMRQAAAMPWLRQTANRWMSRGLSWLAGQPLPDSQCGFRLLRVPVWAALQLQTEHFEAESELLLAFLDRGEPVNFVPIQVIYGREQTKIRVWVDSWRWCRWFWRASRRRAIRNRQAGNPPTDWLKGAPLPGREAG